MINDDNKKILEKIAKRFNTEESCLDFLSHIKWQNGFVCDKCGHTNYCKGKNDFSRRCTKCKKEISSTAHTLFHRCKIPLTTAFKIVYLSCANPDISSYSLSKKLQIRRMTGYTFQKKVKLCLSKENPDPFIEALLKELSS